MKIGTYKEYLIYDDTVKWEYFIHHAMWPGKLVTILAYPEMNKYL